MCILKCFSRLVVSSDVQDGFVLESFPFKHFRVEERDFGLCYFGRKFDFGLEFVGLFNKKAHRIFITVPEGEDIINISFPYSWLGIVLLY